MPKIIENIRERLLNEARQQIENAGYSALTIRSVAAACGVGIGTVYNYFPSKDMLVAGFMLDDWQECMNRMLEQRSKSTSAEQIFRCIYDELRLFTQAHSALFSDKNAMNAFFPVFNQRHSQLRGQIAELIEPVCYSCAHSPSDFLPEFVAESILTWTVSGRSFDEIFSVIGQLFDADISLRITAQ